MTGKARSFSLRTILFADLASYSRLVSKDETGTLDFMERAFEEFNRQSVDFGGVLIKTTGDGVVAEFTSASQAVRYAVEMQRRLGKLRRSAGIDAQFRIGIHLGEVERTDSDIYGHAVNIAARLETQAKPGGICISQEVYQHARRNTGLGFVSDGIKPLKNIPDSVATYHVVEVSDGTASSLDKEGLDIATVDGLAVENTDGEAIEIRSDRVRALLGYLALRPNFSDAPERIGALLWPDKEAADARRSLSNCLRAAKAVLGEIAPGVLDRHGNKIGFDLSRTSVDLIKILSEVASGNVDEILIERPDWPEAILFGNEGVSSLFSSWLRVTRQNWRTRMAEALEASLLRFEAAEPAARRAATALLVIEPSHERALQKLIEHHADCGNTAIAVKVFQEFSELLRQNYRIAPSAETVALIDGIRKSGPAVGKRAADDEKPLRRPRITVGRFRADDVNPASLHLVTGFRSEIIANLSRFRDWVVLEGDHESVDFDGSQPDYAMTAECEKSHPEVAISVKLKEIRSGRVIWSDRFEVSIGNWFETQRSLVKRVAAHTEIYLSSDRLAQLMGTDPLNASDYNDWLRGEHLLTLWSSHAEDEAEQIFRSIVARSPQFAPAHASLASIYNVRHLIRPGLPRDADEDRKALPLAQKAVELDALDARNQQVIAWSSAMAGRYDQAAVHYELAMTLNGSSPKAIISCAQGLAFVGVPDRAHDLLDEAFELAPFFLPYQWCYVASTRYMIGDFEGAVEAAKRGGHATLDNPGWRAAALAKLGRIAEAKTAFKEQVELIKSEWAGSNSPSGSKVMDWFLRAFPIGREKDRNSLIKVLHAACS